LNFNIYGYQYKIYINILNKIFNYLNTSKKTKLNNKMGICSSTEKNKNNNIKNDDKNSTKINENNLEKHITGIIKPTPFYRLQKYSKKTGAICLIINENNDYKINGTGFFCEIKIKEQKIKGLFTNNHILNQNDIQIGKTINFIIRDIEKDINIEKNIKITKERFTLTNEELDYTFIQIFNNEPYNNFFEIDKKINCNNPYEEYKLDEFCIIQYSNNEISISEGKLEKIGIHFMGGEKLNKGIYFKYILDDINKRINDMNFNKEINNKNLDNVNKAKINDENKENQIIALYKINDNKKSKDDKYNILNYYGNNYWENDKELNNKKDFEELIDLFLNNQKIEFQFKFTFKQNKEYKIKMNIKEQLKNLRNMFYNCYSLTSLDLSNFNTNNVINMNNMFYNCSSLTSLNLDNFNTNNVTDMSYMFYNCSFLTSLNLSNFNTNNVTDMSYMFYKCSSLTSLYLDNFNTNKIINMSYMFYKCSSLTSLKLDNFNTINVNNMSYMFYNCSFLTSLNLSNFNTNNVKDMSSMFFNCYSLTSLNLSNFNTNNVKNMSYMFYNCSSLISLNLSNFNTNNVKNMKYMFKLIQKSCKIIENDRKIKSELKKLNIIQI